MSKVIVMCCICGTDYVSSQAGFCPYCVIESLQQELSRYKQGVEVETVATLSDSGTRAEVWLDELPSEFIGQRVKVLVRAKEEV